MTDRPAMKEGLGGEAVARIASALAQTEPGFQHDAFVHQACRGLDALGLKERVHHLIDVLHRHLPDDFPKASAILVKAKAHWDAGCPEDPLNGFAAWPLIDYIAVHGLDHPAVSLPALRALTSLFSAEFAMRPFLLNRYAITYRHLTAWCGDADPAVRRLVSEGTRPRLPWGQRLAPFIADPSPIFPLLERLKSDASESVRRSVANNLNDISKDHPAPVLRTCRAWGEEGLPHGDRLIRHALRTLVKNGHPDVFPLLGYTEFPKISVRDLNLSPPAIRLGEALTASATLTAAAGATQRVVLDYAIHHVKANGRTTAKVFKWKTLVLAPGASVRLSRLHAIRKITTRTYYGGTHAFELLINGIPHGNAPFELVI